MDMTALAVTSFGWPAVFISLGLAVVGLFLRRPGLLLMAAVVSLPFGLYLSVNPRFHVIGPAVLLCLLFSPLALYRQHRLSAAALALPFFAIAGWLLIQLV